MLSDESEPVSLPKLQDPKPMKRDRVETGLSEDEFARVLSAWVIFDDGPDPEIWLAACFTKALAFDRRKKLAEGFRSRNTTQVERRIERGLQSDYPEDQVVAILAAEPSLYLDALLRLWDRGPLTAQVFEALTESFTDIDDHRVSDLMIARLETETSVPRICQCIRALRGVRQSRVNEVLMTFTQHDDPSVRLSVLLVAKPRAIGAAIALQLHRDTDPRIRRMAVSMIKSRVILEKLIHDGDLAVQKLARHALAWS